MRFQRLLQLPCLSFVVAFLVGRGLDFDLAAAWLGVMTALVIIAINLAAAASPAQKGATAHEAPTSPALQP